MLCFSKEIRTKIIEKPRSYAVYRLLSYYNTSIYSSDNSRRLHKLFLLIKCINFHLWFYYVKCLGFYSGNYFLISRNFHHTKADTLLCRLLNYLIISIKSGIAVSNLTPYQWSGSSCVFSIHFTV